MEYNVLVVEDNEEIRSIVEKYLVRNGYHCTVAEDGFVALEKFSSGEFHLIILDVMMPGIDGFEVLKRIRMTSDVPALFLTAKELETDRLRGFDLGADDYVVKPFSPRELMKRVSVILKRVYKEKAEEVLKYKDLVLDRKSLSASKGGKPIVLTSTEFKLLETFMTHVGYVLSREQLIRDAFGSSYDAYDRNIDTYVKKLRKKIGDDSKAPSFIYTRYGAGYQFGGEA
ncbi:MAG: response regulator transcription factor [Spirochaetia bacterium]|jgi:DNA-binding response OmpR family regulator|nr:response regulator transcription factor [Spirochaetia bacterium]